MDLNLNRIIKKQSRTFVTVLGFVLVVVIGVIDYISGPVFSSLTFYLIPVVLALTSGTEPWNGLLKPTDHQFHDSIRKDYKTVVQHPVLKKWLYLPEASEDFEPIASNIVEAIRMNDQRFGVELREKTRGKRKV